MVSDKNIANAVGGKTARACDNCVRKRARWYCAADDAFLCQSCDSSVHSANPLARRHERVRLNTSSSLKTSSKSLEKTSSDVSVTSWHSGFTRKARSPRIKKNGKLNFDEEKGICPLHHLVPDEVSDDTSQEENVEQLLYRVPIFEPFVGNLCNSSNTNESRNTNESPRKVLINQCRTEFSIATDNHFEDGKWSENRSSMLYENQFHGLLPSEMELAEFAADVDSLLGKGLEHEAFDMEALGLMEMDCSFGRGEVKVEEAGIAHDQESDGGLQHTTMPFEYKFGNCSRGLLEEENKIQPHQRTWLRGGDENDENRKGKILLRLDYDGVMKTWDDKRCPWTNGGRPQIESYDQCWPYCMGTCGRVHNYGGNGTMGHGPVVDVGREARVSRYREKRRTRLFSKKIRYEVRKLNAEKRPRMKGRFVKRTSFAPSGFPLLNK